MIQAMMMNMMKNKAANTTMMNATKQTKNSTINNLKDKAVVKKEVEEEEIIFAQPPLYPNSTDSSYSSSSSDHNRSAWFSSVGTAAAASVSTSSYNGAVYYYDVDIESGDGNDGGMKKVEDVDGRKNGGGGNGVEDGNGGGGANRRDDLKKKPSFRIRETARHVTNKAKQHAQQTAQLAKTTLLLGKEDWTWEQLQQIEKRRRETLKKNGLPFFRKLLVWDGTVNAALIKDPLIYIVALIYLGARFAARYTVPDFVSRLGGGNIEIIGGFLTFFLIYYVQTETKRFETMYQLSMACEGRIFDVAAILRAYAPRDRALRLIRYLNATHVSAYVGLSPTYTYENLFLNMNEKCRFLSDRELDRITTINMNGGGSVYMELLTWCMSEINQLQKLELVDQQAALQLRELVCQLRGHIAGLYDYDDQPIHFYYVHFVCFLSVVYLPLSAIQLALQAGTGDNVYWVNDVVTGSVVMLQAVFIVGLRLLAEAMEKPYESDLEDLSVITYIMFTWTMSRRMLESQLPCDVDLAHEEQLCREQFHIGPAWRNYSGEGSNNVDDISDCDPTETIEYNFESSSVFLQFDEGSLPELNTNLSWRK